MYKFDIKKVTRIKVKAKCPKHTKYNPETMGPGGRNSVCKTCQQIYEMWDSKVKAEIAQRKFESLAEPFIIRPAKRASKKVETPA
jgi:hypothetical protein